jgi:hypothetical protein
MAFPAPLLSLHALNGSLLDTLLVTPYVQVRQSPVA